MASSSKNTMSNLNDLLGNLSTLNSLQGKRYLLEIYQNRVRIPEPNDRIYKNECSLSFDTPMSKGGLYIDMQTFYAFGEDYVGTNFKKTNNPIYLHIKKTKRLVPEDRPIGRGLYDNDTQYDETHTIFIFYRGLDYQYGVDYRATGVFPDHVSLPFPSDLLPERVRLAAVAILQNAGADNLTEMSHRIHECDPEVRSIPKPGHEVGVGLVNLGNSSYLAATMQVVLSCLTFKCYDINEMHRMFEKTPGDPTMNFNIQLLKLTNAFSVGKYSGPVVTNANSATTSVSVVQEGIPPQMFKAVVADGHSEFSSTRPQDAAEYLLHFFNKVKRESYGGAVDPVYGCKFGVEHRIVCSSGKVAYNRSYDYILSLNIPLHEAIMPDDEFVLPRVRLEACLANFSAPVEVHDFYSTALQTKTTAMKSVSLTSFPDYLVLHMQRYVMEQGAPKKLDVSVAVPKILDISGVRSKGRQPGEELYSDTPVTNESLPDGKGRYQLLGFVSHVGSSMDSGHYVAHVRKLGRWVLFDDNIVGAVRHPPKDMGYLYFFERLE